MSCARRLCRLVRGCVVIACLAVFLGKATVAWAQPTGGRQRYVQYVDPETGVMMRPSSHGFVEPFGDGVWRSSWFYSALLLIKCKEPAAYRLPGRPVFLRCRSTGSRSPVTVRSGGAGSARVAIARSLESGAPGSLVPPFSVADHRGPSPPLAPALPTESPNERLFQGPHAHRKDT